MLDAQYLDHSVFHAIRHHVILMHHQFTRAGHPTGATHGGKPGQKIRFILDFANE